MTEYKNPSDAWYTNHKDGKYTTAVIVRSDDLVDRIDLTKNDVVIKVTPKVILPTYWQIKSGITGDWRHVYMAATMANHTYYASSPSYRQVEPPKEITK